MEQTAPRVLTRKEIVIHQPFLYELRLALGMGVIICSMFGVLATLVAMAPAETCHHVLRKG